MGLNVGPGIFLGSVWSPRDFGGFWFLPPFDHTCPLKSGVPPSPCAIISLLINPMVITEPPEPSARLLSLGSKLYPSNMQRMLNKDLIRFKQILSRVRQNRTSKKRFCWQVWYIWNVCIEDLKFLLLEKMQLAKYSCFIWKGTCISHFTKSRENGYKLLVQWILGSFGLTSVSYDMVDGIEGNYWPIISDACLLPEIVFF